MKLDNATIKFENRSIIVTTKTNGIDFEIINYIPLKLEYNYVKEEMIRIKNRFKEMFKFNATLVEFDRCELSVEEDDD